MRFDEYWELRDDGNIYVEENSTESKNPALVASFSNNPKPDHVFLMAQAPGLLNFIDDIKIAIEKILDKGQIKWWVLCDVCDKIELVQYEFEKKIKVLRERSQGESTNA